MTTLTKRRSTIIGASGFIGSKLEIQLRSMDIEVMAPPRGHETELIGQDLGDFYYCAGMTSDFATNPTQTMEAHVALISRLLEKCDFRTVLYLSSSRLYDRPTASSDNFRGVRESDSLHLNACNPRHLFDLTKAAGEAVSLALAGEKATVARLACVWDVDTAATGFLPRVIHQLRAKKQNNDQTPLSLSSNLNSLRHYIHISDVLTAMQAMTDCLHQHRIITLATDEIPIDNRTLFDCLRSWSGINIDAKTMTTVDLTAPKLDLGIYQQLVGKENMPSPFIKDLKKRLKSWSTLPQ